MSTLYVDTITEKTSGNGVQIPGHVVQVVNATLTSSVSTTSNAFVDTSLTASITPTSTSNKILILTNLSMYASNSLTQGAATVYRGNTSTGTNLGHSVYGFGAAYSSAGPVKGNISVNYLDSPATTSSQTYTVAIASTDNSSTVQLNINLETATLTLMEIAQ